MPQVSFEFEVKTLSETGQFTGIASAYSNRDNGDDVVEPGAFTKTLASGKVRKLLWQHREPVGVVELNDSASGLQAKGQLNLDKQAGRDAYSDLKFYKKNGSPLGLSIGFETLDSWPDGAVRHLTEIKLWEVSIVTFPMNDRAVVDSVKSADVARLAHEIQEFKAGLLAELKG